MRVKNRMRVIRSSGSVRGGAGDIPAYSAEREPRLALVGQRLVGAVAVDLQDAAKAGKMHGGPLVLAVGLVDIGDARRLRVAPGPIVARVGPELAGLGLSPARIKHRRPRLVGEQLHQFLQYLEQPLMHGAKREGGAARPIGQRRAVEFDALTRVNLNLPVEW